MEYDPTLEDSDRKLVEIEDKLYMFNMYKAVLGQYYALLEQWVREASAAIVVFSINRSGSFDTAKDCVRRIKNVRMEAGLNAIPIALVGNRTSVEGQRVVTAEEIEVSRRTGNCEIVTECFASHDNPSVMNKVFFDLGHAILNRPSKDQPKQENPEPGEEGAVTARRKRLARKIKSIFGS